MANYYDFEESNKKQQTSVKRAGTGFLDLYTRRLLFTHDDFSVQKDGITLNLTHVYNEKFSPLDAMSPSINLTTGNMCMGGWKTNLHQHIFATTPEQQQNGEPKYYYIDQYGYTRKFIEISENNTTKLKNDDSFELTLESIGNSQHTISDAGGNKMFFDSIGRLYKITNNKNKEILITYQDSTSFKITEISIGTSVVAIFNYTNDLLSSINYGTGVRRNISFSYSETNPTLLTITYPYEESTTFEYDSNRFLKTITDQTGYSVQYLRNNSTVEIKEYTNVSSINETGITMAQNEITGEILSVSYENEYTTVSTNGGKKKIYHFDNNARSFLSYVSDNVDNFSNVDNLEYSTRVYSTDKRNYEQITIASGLNKTNYLQKFMLMPSGVKINESNGGYTLTSNTYLTQTITNWGNKNVLVFSLQANLGQAQTNPLANLSIKIVPLYNNATIQGLEKCVNLRVDTTKKQFGAVGVILKDFDANVVYPNNLVQNALHSQYNGYPVDGVKVTVSRENISGNLTLENLRLEYCSCIHTIVSEDGKSTIVENGDGKIAYSIKNDAGLTIEDGIVDKNEQLHKNTYAYNGNKQLTSSTDYRNITTGCTYDDLGRLTEKRITVPNNKYLIAEKYAYDESATAYDRVMAYDDRNSNYAKYDYNKAYHELVKFSMPNNQETRCGSNNGIPAYVYTTLNSVTYRNNFTYRKGLLVKVVTDTGETVNYEYDGFGRIVRVLVNGAMREEYVYKTDCNYTQAGITESNYNFTLKIFANGDKEKIYYNKNGQAYKKIHIDSNGVERLLCYVAYWPDGNVDTITDYTRSYEGNNATINGKLTVYQNHYDGNGDLDYTSVEDYDPSSTTAHGSFRYIYDDEKRLTSYALTRDGISSGANFTYEQINGSYYPDNRITKVSIDGKDITYTYDSFGRLVKRGMTTLGSDFSENYTYGGTTNTTNNDIVQFSIISDFDTTTESFTYDANRNITSRTIGSQNVTHYEYDKLDRLIREDNYYEDFTKVYSYDNNGNRTEEKVYWYSPDVAIESLGSYNARIAYSYNGSKLMTVTKYNGNDVITSSQNISNYDLSGNPCNYKNNMLQWSRGNRLTAFGNNTYVYNSDGIRIKKTVGNVVHDYFVEGEKIVGEKIGNQEISYLYDLTGITGIKTGPSESQLYFFQKNVLGDIVAIVDWLGNIVARYYYDAWGNHRVSITNGVDNDNHIGRINPFRYRGYYYDSETGLYYLNARYYDPTIGRFINADDSQYLEPDSIFGLNAYAYCYNNPVMWVDPSGHWAISTFLIGLAISSLISWGLSEIFGNQIVGGASSIANGYGAIATGLGLLSFGPIGWIAGGLLIIAGAGAMIIGTNEIVDGITGTNYIQEWTGWSDDLYNGLYIGSNIVSSVGTIAGNIYMKYNPPYPGRNPNKIPDGFNDRVNPKANYYNPKTDQSLRPDLNHAEPIGPHWDWIDSNGVGWRLYRFWRKIK